LRLQADHSPYLIHLVLVNKHHFAYKWYAMTVNELFDVLAGWANGQGALHERLAAGITEAIRQGNLLPATRMPSERVLAKSLAVSRTTVLTAYNNLRAAGWLESRAGSGTWVRRATAINARAQTRAGVLSRISLLNLLVAEGSGAIDFGAATTMPLTTLPEGSFALPDEQLRLLLQERDYMPFGLPVLRDRIAKMYSKLGAKTSAEQVLITTGAQQAISLITALYVQRGDPVLVEDPTFFGALDVFRFAGARTAPLAVGPNHIAVNTLRNRILTVSPRLLYVTPTFQNPTGAKMAESSRQGLAELVSEFQIPTIEDETLAEMVLESSRPRPVAAYGGGENVLTIGSLSKLFCAGLRVGWIRGSAAQIGRLARIKSSMDLGSALLPQAIGAQLLTYLDAAVELRRAELLAKRDLVERYLTDCLPDWTYARPIGGLSFWVQLPHGDAATFAQIALRRHVAIAHGNLFSASGSYPRHLRIPFLLDAEALKTGMTKLNEVWREMSSTDVKLGSASTMII
jgi:DNA-binding transcriptional MocR family regulator